MMDKNKVTLVDKIVKVINDHFQIDPEVFEVCMYAISTIAINDAVLKGILSKSTEVRGIPPESYKLMKIFDNGLTVNKFWAENFAPIKAQLALDDIKSHTMGKYLSFAESNTGDENARKDALNQARSVEMGRFDVLTTIMFLWKGVKAAEEFDRFFRLIVQLSPEHEKYFKDRGI